MMNKDVFLVIPNGAGAKETPKTAKDLNLKSGQKAVGYVEIDKFARQSYQTMFDTTGEWFAEEKVEEKD